MKRLKLMLFSSIVILLCLLPRFTLSPFKGVPRIVLNLILSTNTESRMISKKNKEDLKYKLKMPTIPIFDEQRT